MATELAFEIIARDSASKTFGRVGKSADGLGKNFDGAGKSATTMGSSIGAASAGAAAGVGKLGKAVKAGIAGIVLSELSNMTLGVFEAAASLDQLEKKGTTVFGNQADEVRAWAAETANAMGLTSREAVGLAASFGDLLVPMGFSRKEAAKMSTEVIGLSGALSEWSGGQRTAAEVADALSSAMLGEREQLKELGIAISEADVDARLAAKGQKELTGAAREQAEAIATMELIFAKSTDAQKAFAKGGDTLGRSLSESKARLKDLGDELLVKATPALTKLADIVADYVLPAVESFVRWLSGPGVDLVAFATLDWTSKFLTFAKFTIDTFDGLTKFFVGWAHIFLQQAEFAFGWLPDIGPKIKKARDQFTQFADDVLENLGKASSKVDDWNDDVDKMKKIIALKVNKKDLDEKLKNARMQLNDKDLTKERRAKLNADIAKLLARKRAAQRAIDSLRGKTVTINVDTRYRNFGSPGSFQHGTLNAPRGLALVGERGPELVAFRGGESVFTATQTESMLSRLGRQITLPQQTSHRQMPARRATAPVEVHFHAGVVGSQRELRNWLSRSLDDLNRQGRLAGIVN
ncbi:hypothetical protein ABN034_19320 [Actinopolymorpha sp. B11F2]|uniref:hypothetical protein n=1 Tax=Actinopolymorpha sp. B11F2 TaxID=3160862 RepID=UPI0032E42A5B